jgi:sigma-B regulation protein RsbU (phosphoserine phosphatase)
LLPYASPALPGWQLAATWRPARETAGDFYDFISLPDGRLGIVIADVVDKGMGAALMMALIRTLIRTYAAEYPDQPARVMQMANQRLIADVDVGMFVTLFYGTLDPISGRLIYSNAGHPPPYLFPTAPDSPVTSLAATGIPLGISESRWEPGSLTIEPGELLFFYTDGVTDAMDQHGETLGIERILEAIREARSLPAGQIQDNVLARVYAHALGQPQVDDITLVVLVQELERPEKKKEKERPLEVSQFRAGRTRIL